MPATASPFALPADLEGQKHALTTALSIVQGFALYFVVSDPSRVRPRLMDEIEARLAGKTVQRIAVPPGTRNLLHLFEQTLTDPLPDVLFVYGFENTVSGSAEPRSHPLLLNLNATRNNFYAVSPRPVVLWVPAFVLTAIMHDAPDLLSVRSGVYTFPLGPEERRDLAEVLESLGQTRLMGLEDSERLVRISEMQQLLAEIRSMPAPTRNRLDEARVLSGLAMAYHVTCHYSESERLNREALDIRRSVLPPGHPDIATSLTNLAGLYCSLSRYLEAEPLYLEAIDIRRSMLPSGHPDIALSLSNLGELYRSEGRYAEAEALHLEALNMRRSALPSGHVDIAKSLNNLAELYRTLGRYSEAEVLHLEALSIRRSALSSRHPLIAVSLTNLAGTYQRQGRYLDAERLYLEALESLRSAGLSHHPNIATSLSNLAALYYLQGRYSDAEPLYREALVITRQALGENDPTTAIMRDNLSVFLREKAHHEAKSK